MKVKDITSKLEQLAPRSLQESYDNSGLLTGDPNMQVTGVLISLDCIESIVNEAIDKKCNLIVSHHPILFKGLKSLTGKSYIERTLIKAIKNDIALYAIHTNLDNVLGGVNQMFATKIGLENCEILAPKTEVLRKCVVLVPEASAEEVRLAMFNAGAGAIGKYDQCSFNTLGKGTFRAGEGTNPFIGEIGKIHTESEVKIEVIYLRTKEQEILTALKAAHPYEEVAYEIIALENDQKEVGSGMVGTLKTPLSERDFLEMLKNNMQLKGIRHTVFTGKMISKVAVCGGSGSFLLPNALARQADAYVSADFKYHEFFDAEEKLLIADIGHYESEQFTMHLLFDFLTEKFPTFAVRLTTVNTNPLNYF